MVVVLANVRSSKNSKANRIETGERSGGIRRFVRSIPRYAASRTPRHSSYCSTSVDFGTSTKSRIVRVDASPNSGSSRAASAASKSRYRNLVQSKYHSTFREMAYLRVAFRGNDLDC